MDASSLSAISAPFSAPFSLPSLAASGGGSSEPSAVGEAGSVAEATGRRS